MEVFKYNDIMSRFQARSSAYIQFDNTMFVHRFFKIWCKNLHSKNSGYMWMVKFNLKMLRVDADFF